MKKESAFMIIAEIEMKITNWEAIRQRTVTIELKETIKIIKIYAPTTKSALKEKEKYCKGLKQTVDWRRKINKHIIVMKDWNVKIGSDIIGGLEKLGSYCVKSLLIIIDNGVQMIIFWHDF